MIQEDIVGVAAVHEAAFPRQTCSLEWVRCNFSAFPRMQYFVAVSGGDIQGYVHWSQKSGFRDEVILELEQIAVAPPVQGQGTGTRLIRESLPIVKVRLADRRAVIKNLWVTTRADNASQRLYHTVLGAEVECTIRDLYSADEVIMVARDVADEA